MRVRPTWRAACTAGKKLVMSAGFHGTKPEPRWTAARAGGILEPCSDRWINRSTRGASLVRGLRTIPRWAYAAVALYWLGIVLTEVAALRLDQDPHAISWPHVYLKRVLLNLYWFGVSILALGWYAERPLTAERIGRTLAETMTTTLLATLGFSLWTSAVFAMIISGSSRLIPIKWSSGFLYAGTTWQIVIAANAYHYYRQLMNGRKESADLQLRLVRTELMLFRAQLEPHFCLLGTRGRSAAPSAAGTTARVGWRLARSALAGTLPPDATSSGAIAGTRGHRASGRRPAAACRWQLRKHRDDAAHVAASRDAEVLERASRPRSLPSGASLHHRRHCPCAGIERSPTAAQLRLSDGTQTPLSPRYVPEIERALGL